MSKYGSIRRGELRWLELGLQDSGLFAVGIITMKAMAISIVIGVFLMVAMSHIKSATAANIKSVVTIESDLLHVGDVFDKAGDKADVVIGRAPVPGKDMTLNARTLLRIARSTNISWTPQSVLDQVVIRREATLVDVNSVHDQLSEALSERGLSGKLDIVIQNNLPQITLPKSEPATIEVQSLRYMPENGNFEAVLVAPSKENPLQRVAVNGVAHKRVMIPVLASSMRAGDIISASDITYVDVRERDLPKNSLVQIADIQGMAAAKSLTAGRPVRGSDISLPRLVSRGEMITIIYKDGPISLSAKGKSLQNGARGETIRILNVASNKHLQGTVSGDGQVTLY